MKHFSWLIALLLVCSTQVSFADDCNRCDPCLNDCSFCDFDFCDVTYDAYVDYLYWEFCYDHEGDRSSKYNSGWRFGLNLNYDDWMLGFRYTQIKHDRGNHEFDYKNLDIDMGYTVHFSCAPIDFTPFFGAKLVWAELNGFEDTDFDAYGLRIGFNTRYNLCNWTFCDNSVPLALVARSSVGLLRESHHCKYMPVHELYLGLDMRFCDLFCEKDANLQIGYEVQSFERHSVLGLGGLVARFGMGF